MTIPPKKTVVKDTGSFNISVESRLGIVEVTLTKFIVPSIDEFKRELSLALHKASIAVKEEPANEYTITMKLCGIQYQIAVEEIAKLLIGSVSKILSALDQQYLKPV